MIVGLNCVSKLLSVLLLLYALSGNLQGSEAEILLYPSKVYLTKGEKVVVYVYVKNKGDESISIPNGKEIGAHNMIPFNCNLHIATYSIVSERVTPISEKLGGFSTTGKKFFRNLKKGESMFYKITCIPFFDDSNATHSVVEIDFPLDKLIGKQKLLFQKSGK